MTQFVRVKDRSICPSTSARARPRASTRSWARPGLAAPRQFHHARLVAALEQLGEELGVDLPLEMRDGPPLAVGLDLVERARDRVVALGQGL